MPRFNFELGEEASSMLDTLAKWTDRGRRAEVVRDALAVYEALVRRAIQGNRLFYGPDPRSLTELDIVVLSHARHKALGDREISSGPVLHHEERSGGRGPPAPAVAGPGGEARGVRHGR